jgi:hypothetical protein
MYLWNFLKGMLLILVVIFGGKDGVIDLCINQTKKKGTQSKTLDALLCCLWGVFMAPLFILDNPFVGTKVFSSVPTYSLSLLLV